MPLHKCQQCTRTFNRLDALRSHLRGHHPGNAYECRECERGFKHDSSLARHHRMTGHQGMVLHQAVLQEAYAQLNDKAPSAQPANYSGVSQASLEAEQHRALVVQERMSVVQRLIQAHQSESQRLEAERQRLNCIGSIMAAAGITASASSLCPALGPPQPLNTAEHPNNRLLQQERDRHQQTVRTSSSVMARSAFGLSHYQTHADSTEQLPHLLMPPQGPGVPGASVMSAGYAAATYVRPVLSTTALQTSNRGTAPFARLSHLLAQRAALQASQQVLATTSAPAQTVMSVFAQTMQGEQSNDSLSGLLSY
eukprot:TRINITY_DN6096_c0_g1_i1.p1 TRINITY_DN6096_c0_g1~~TRINITY_DN6096_c0_g1_i1.p1  ORF type:complete len:310 (+),score=44.56 TRINITY_DN6096_c0_g1_i1:324-1253(+)